MMMLEFEPSIILNKGSYKVVPYFTDKEDTTGRKRSIADL